MNGRPSSTSGGKELDIKSLGKMIFGLLNIQATAPHAHAERRGVRSIDTVDHEFGFNS